MNASSHSDFCSPDMDAQAALDYWTPERMGVAQPVDELESEGIFYSQPSPPGGIKDFSKTEKDLVSRPYQDDLRSRVTGRLYFELGGQPYRGTAFIVTPERGGPVCGNVLGTCLHNVYDEGTKVWADSIIFIPSYNSIGLPCESDWSDCQGESRRHPYGIWPVIKARVPLELLGDEVLTSDLDVAVCTVANNREGKTIMQVVGGALEPLLTDKETLQPVARIGDVSCLGYPGQGHDEFSGHDMWRFTGELGRVGSTIGFGIFTVAPVQSGKGFSGSPFIAEADDGRSFVIATHSASLKERPEVAVGAPFFLETFFKLRSDAYRESFGAKKPSPLKPPHLYRGTGRQITLVEHLDGPGESYRVYAVGVGGLLSLLDVQFLVAGNGHRYFTVPEGVAQVVGMSVDSQGDESVPSDVFDLSA